MDEEEVGVAVVVDMVGMGVAEMVDVDRVVLLSAGANFVSKLKVR